MRKAVIAVPPVRDFYFTPHRASALGARILNRELEDNGWDTVLLNLPLMGKARTVTRPRELEYLKHYIVSGETGPLSWFTACHRFGPSFSESAELIAGESPDLLFISSFAWAYADLSLQLAEAAVRIRPELPVIIGGHGPSSLPEYFLKAVHPVYPGRPLFSLVVSGEIEGFGELLRPGKADNRFLDLRKLNPKCDIKPMAGESILRAGRRSISITLTRGCPLKCRFCSNHICHGRDFRSSPPGMWVDEVIRINEKYGDTPKIFHLNIEDDNILFMKNDFFSFLDAVRKHYPEVSFSAENGLDYMMLEEQDIIRLKQSGFTRLNLSLAVLSEDSRNKEHRDGDPEKLEKLIHHCHEADLPVTTHFICGLDGDNREDIVKTLRFLDRLPCQTGISNFYPVPGLEGFEDAELFLNRSPSLALGSSVYPWTGALSSAQMITAFRLARWSNFRKKLLEPKEKPFPGSTGADSDTEEELFRKITGSRRLHTILKVGKKGSNRTVVPLSHLDEDMVEGFFR